MIQIRERLSEKFDRERLRLELKRSTRPTGVLLVGYVIAIGCMGLIIANVGRELYSETQTVRFEVDSARAVRPGVQEVKFKGITAGVITDAKLVDGRAYLTAKVETKYGAIYRDATARIRPKTVLQDMFLDITDPGTAPAGRASERAPVARAQTQTSVNVADVLQTFSPNTRERLGRVLDQLGGGVDGRGDDLRRAFVQTVPFLQVAGQMSEQLTERSEMTRRLVRNASLLTAELADREQDVRTLVEAGAATLRTTADGSRDLDATIAELPGTLDALDSSFAALRGVLPELDGALQSLDPVAERLPAGLDALQSLSETAEPAVNRLQGPVRELVPLSTALQPLSDRLNTTATALRPQVPDIDKVTAATVPCRYSIERFFQWTPSVFKMNDARGVAPRAYVTAGVGFSPFNTDPNVFAGKACTPGTPVAAEPGPGGGR